MTRTFGKTKEDSDLFLNPTDTSNLYNYVLVTGLIIIILFKYNADNTSKLPQSKEFPDRRINMFTITEIRARLFNL